MKTEIREIFFVKSETILCEGFHDLFFLVKSKCYLDSGHPRCTTGGLGPVGYGGRALAVGGGFALSPGDAIPTTIATFLQNLKREKH